MCAAPEGRLFALGEASAERLEQGVGVEVVADDAEGADNLTQGAGAGGDDRATRARRLTSGLGLDAHGGGALADAYAAVAEAFADVTGHEERRIGQVGTEVKPRTPRGECAEEGALVGEGEADDVGAVFRCGAEVVVEGESLDARGDGGDLRRSALGAAGERDADAIIEDVQPVATLTVGAAEVFEEPLHGYALVVEDAFVGHHGAGDLADAGRAHGLDPGVDDAVFGRARLGRVERRIATTADVEVAVQDTVRTQFAVVLHGRFESVILAEELEGRGRGDGLHDRGRRELPVALVVIERLAVLDAFDDERDRGATQDGAFDKASYGFRDFGGTPGRSGGRDCDHQQGAGHHPQRRGASSFSFHSISCSVHVSWPQKYGPLPPAHNPRRGDAEGAVCRGAKAVALKAFVTFARELLT